MALRVYNTLTRKIEIFKPRKGKLVGMYVCGPTVYGPGHVGHARSYIAFDIIRRYLEYKGYKVKYVMNLTDIHDDIIKAANQKKVHFLDLANKYIRVFLKEQKALGIKKASVYPRVTEHIPEIIRFIQGLIKRGFAYEKDGSVYFDVSKFKDYGKLSGIKLKKAVSGTRVAIDRYEKEEACDFALWKAAKPNEPTWESPWGKGRPGWHIECSVMSQKYLGEQFDVHGGGRDLIFPHHENEIAQSEALTGKKPFVKYWLHSGLLTINGQKMSKSLGNYIEIGKALKVWPARVIRFFVASSHYRSPLDWTEKNLLKAKGGIERIDEFVQKIQNSKSKKQNDNEKLRGNLVALRNSKFKIDKFKNNFEEAMDDDFNTPKAIAVIFELIRDINPILDKNQITKNQAKQILDFLKSVDKVFGFIFKKERAQIPKVVKELVKKREILRKQKKWEEADKIRKKIEEMGWKIKDTPQGPKLSKK
ncbi:cysteine--tRNA ligase [bacterium]|nr:cysteine--tRNA ligase [bacterium]